MIPLSHEEFILMSAFLEKISGITVPAEKRYLFTTRLGDFLEEMNVGFGEFYLRLKAADSGPLVRKLVEFMTTNETSFFRDDHPFHALKDSVLPTRLSTPGRKFHVWSAGCSTGQEPYSIAMTILDWLKNRPIVSQDQITIYASDISEKILEKAQNGLYTEDDVQRGLSKEHRNAYFSKVPGGWQISPEVRKLVKFTALNLSEPFAHFGRFDMIFCRNVTIYFSQELKQRILAQFCQMLLPSGILVLGASETIYPDLGCYKSTGHGNTLFFEKVS